MEEITILIQSQVTTVSDVAGFNFSRIEGNLWQCETGNGSTALLIHEDDTRFKFDHVLVLD